MYACWMGDDPEGLERVRQKKIIFILKKFVQKNSFRRNILLISCEIEGFHHNNCPFSSRFHKFVKQVVSKPSFRFIAAPVMKMSKRLPDILRDRVAERFMNYLNFTCQT